MELMTKLDRKQPLKQHDLTAFIDVLTSSSEDLNLKLSYLEKLSQKGIEQAELTYLVKSLIATTYPKQPYYPGAMCICGTGGDRSHSFNISTTVSFVVASAGVPIIKHGNKSITSASGSTDLLETMQIKTLSIQEAKDHTEKYNLSFLSATETYPIMKMIQPVRKLIAHPTIFNITGPMIHPYQLDYQVMGVYEPTLMRQIAQTLRDLGRKRVIVIHGAGGMDEATLSGDNIIYELQKNGEINTYHINATDVGLDFAENEELKGGSPNENYMITKRILLGEDKGAKYQTVVLNAAIALYVSERVVSIQEGVELAQTLINNGTAYQKYLELGGKSDDNFR